MVFSKALTALRIPTSAQIPMAIIKTVNDAVIIVPLIKEYYDVGIKNDDQLVKLAAVVQRLVGKGQESGEGNGMILSEEEKKQLMDEVISISNNEK